MPRIVAFALPAAIVVFSCAAQAGAVEIVSGWVSSLALDPRVGSTWTSDTEPVGQIPFHFSSDAIQGAARSSASYDFSSMGSTSLFEIHIEEQIPESFGPGNLHGQTRSSGNVNISLPFGGSYDVSGLFQATGVTPRVDLRARIVDVANNTDIFHSYQVSNGINGVPRTIDLLQAPSFSTWIGSPTGTLPAGEYRLSYVVDASNGFTPNALGNLTGDLSFQIIENVPEPSTLVLAGLGMLGLLVLRHGRKRKLMTSIAVIGLMCASASRLPAATIGIGDFSGNETVVDFGNPNSDSVFSSPTTIGGLTFTVNSGAFFVIEPAGFFSSLFSNVPGASQLGTLRDAAATSDVVLTFSTIVHRAGLLLSAGTSVPATWEVTAFSGASPLGSVVVTQPAGNQAVFAGLEFLQNITSVRVSETAGGNAGATAIDDVRFEAVPEPSTLVLASGAAFGLLLVARRRRITHSRLKTQLATRNFLERSDS